MQKDMILVRIAVVLSTCCMQLALATDLLSIKSHFNSFSTLSATTVEKDKAYVTQKEVMLLMRTAMILDNLLDCIAFRVSSRTDSLLSCRVPTSLRVSVISSMTL
jgi:hypothetical protein